uniref:Restriction endonuclease n=2 Tax=unclassified Candidatus Kentrum TaxID=2643149 RepID=A0A451A2H3_9GAMM|nr:MAG: Putative restriction endonuclease [Candidatus Kentron sp. LPFa]VFK60224.1 MAG: Putative restriction endonuclease [Candidatus Kentron sp. UNK]VFK68418.1 MAG: Putative restriction endonuclease [Candidatus Kentron sp. UNK]
MSPSLNHSYLCKRIIIEIEKTDQWEAWPELTLDIGPGMIPDIAIYERGKLQPNFHQDTIKCAVLPRLVIEVASPSQSMHDLMQKADKFLQAGIPAVWTIEPTGKIVYISEKDFRKVETAGIITTEGIRLDFPQIFHA